MHGTGNFWRKLGVLTSYDEDSIHSVEALGHLRLGAALGHRRLHPSKPDAEIRIAYDVVWNGSPYEVGESAPDVQGRPVQLERLECYVSDFAIHDVDEGWLPIDTVARIDFSKDDAHAVLTIPGEGDRTIDGLRMGLGVPEDRNVDVDPASYTDPDHPLGYTGSAGLHWGWAAGYIFSVYEGRLLTEPNTLFTYHAGDDLTFRTTELMWEEPWLLECGSKDRTHHAGAGCLRMPPRRERHHRP